MKATLLFFIGLFLSTVHLQAQQSEMTPASPPKYKYEIGTNITPMLRYILSNVGGTASNTSSHLTLRKYSSETKFTKFSLGVAAGYSRNNSDDFTTDNLNIGLQGTIGVGKIHRLNDKFFAVTGFDFSTGWSNRTADDLNQNSFSAGLGPVLGLQYNINERVGLYTETSAQLRASYFRAPDDRSSFNLGLSYGLPVNLNVFVRF